MSKPTKILLALLVATVVLVAGLAGVGFLLPDKVGVVRSVHIDRPPPTVFTVLNGFRQFDKWSPWADLDPGMKFSTEGPFAGVGARYFWSSSVESVGFGDQEIVESRPYEEIVMRLHFGGVNVDNRTRFHLTGEEGGTRVEWHYEADFGTDIVGRYFGLLLNRMIGPDYERGLSRLKTLVETLPTADFGELGVEYLRVEARPIAYLSGHSSTSAQDVARAYAESFEHVHSALHSAGIQQIGPTLAIGRRWEGSRDLYEFDAAVIIPADISTNSARRLAISGVKRGKTYAGMVLRATHQGPHQGSMSEHLNKLMAYKLAAGLRDDGPPWDVYLSNPLGSRNIDELVTETYVPVK
ncbi:MAG: SRPBCC family protein [Panacagrimonas sp.]